MQIIRGLEALNEAYPDTVLTIGNFDGVHLGHQKIFSRVIERAKEIKGTSMVMTFEPHPVKVLAPEREIKLLTPFEEKAKIIESTGIDVLLCAAFNREFASLLPDEFIEDVLVKKINAREIIVGSNYAFGKNKKGTVDILRRRGRKFGFNVRVVRHVKINGVIVSSSNVRNLLIRGSVNGVSNLLGRAYSIEGTVIKGKGRGKNLMDIPTANITTPVEISPKEGVYAVRAAFNGGIYDGVANIGKNPTFGNSNTSYEVHLLNFSYNILGKKLKIFFIERIRNERIFPDVHSLEKQIRRDIEYAKEILRIKNPKLI
ncbi:MAG: bifunctional riboflavin kinase/FAD synthetase [Nitrospirae bacterium]|nr:bifunctional riboflavin kinase/FAD synthetase [Nitrospirota bacterium]